MPTPERTSLAAIVRAGGELLERDGRDGLTMQAVAERVGVRAPSLYKRVRGRDELLGMIASATARELGARVDAALDAAPDDEDAGEALVRLAREVRAFAHERPVGFALVFAPGSEVPVDPDALRASSAGVLRVSARAAGEEHALSAARTVTAWASGFLAMERAGAFRLDGGDAAGVDAAFDYGIRSMVRAFAASRS